MRSKHRGNRQNFLGDENLKPFLERVVPRVDNFIQRINLYPVDNIKFNLLVAQSKLRTRQSVYPLVSDLSAG